MPKVFGWADASPSERNLTVAGLIDAKRHGHSIGAFLPAPASGESGCSIDQIAKALNTTRDGVRSAFRHFGPAWALDSPGGLDRNLALKHLRETLPPKRPICQVTANSEEEAADAEKAGIDMIIASSRNAEAARRGSAKLFLTAAIALPDFVTADDVLREAFRVMALGVDAVMTQRSLRIVSMLASEDIPVMGHLGLVPRKSTWVGGLRAVGATAHEAASLMRNFRRLEEAGAFAVEAEVIPSKVMAEISARTRLVAVSLGSGPWGDVAYLFMDDICGESAFPPRHARAFGDLRPLRPNIGEARVRALEAFREAAETGEFPGEAESASIPEEELAAFKEWVETGAH